MTYFWKRGILDPIKTRDNLMIVGEALVAPRQHLFIIIGIRSITSDSVVDSGERGKGESRKRHGSGGCGLLAEELMGNVPSHQHPLYVVLTPGPCANTCRLEHSNHQHLLSSRWPRLSLDFLSPITCGNYSCFFPLTHHAPLAQSSVLFITIVLQTFPMICHLFGCWVSTNMVCVHLQFSI